jgi:hypothetical protein
MPDSVNGTLPQVRTAGPVLQAALAKAVFTFDRQLQKNGRVFCYSSDPQCVFRLGFKRLADTVRLANGFELPAGSAIVELHLRNERLPILTHGVTPFAWGLRFSRDITYSLRLLSAYPAARTDCGAVAAIKANMAFGTAEKTAQHLRFSGRYGFVPSWGEAESFGGVAHRLGENILISMMVYARDANALRFSSLRRTRVPVFLLRSEFDRRYGGEVYNPLRSLAS